MKLEEGGSLDDEWFPNLPCKNKMKAWIINKNNQKI